MIIANYLTFEQIQQSMYTDPDVQNKITPADINQAINTKLNQLANPSYGFINTQELNILSNLVNVVTTNYIANPTDAQIDNYLNIIYAAAQSSFSQVTNQLPINICGYLVNESSLGNRVRTKSKLKKGKDQLMGLLSGLVGMVVGAVAGLVIGLYQGDTGDELLSDVLYGAVLGAGLGAMLFPAP